MGDGTASRCGSAGKKWGGLSKRRCLGSGVPPRLSAPYRNPGSPFSPLTQLPLPGDGRGSFAKIESVATDCKNLSFAVPSPMVTGDGIEQKPNTLPSATRSAIPHARPRYDGVGRYGYRGATLRRRSSRYGFWAFSNAFWRVFKSSMSPFNSAISANALSGVGNEKLRIIERSCASVTSQHR
jgi:hypothetical protein